MQEIVVKSFPDGFKVKSEPMPADDVKSEPNVDKSEPMPSGGFQTCTYPGCRNATVTPEDTKCAIHNNRSDEAPKEEPIASAPHRENLNSKKRKKKRSRSPITRKRHRSRSPSIARKKHRSRSASIARLTLLRPAGKRSVVGKRQRQVGLAGTAKRNDLNRLMWSGGHRVRGGPQTIHRKAT